MFAPITPEPKDRAQGMTLSKIEKSFTAPPSSLTGASCCRGARTQKPRFSSDHDVYRSRQPTIGKEQEAITQALHILSLLRARARD
jgi:hypothetical protein